MSEATTLDGLVDRIANLASRKLRLVVAIAGPPAAGKSTLGAAVQSALPERAAVLGLDAFHFDDAVLIERDHRDRKGAVFTFDVDGYRRCLATLIAAAGTDIAIPVFDRELELSRNGAAIVPAGCDIIITEGNYLLLEADGWDSLAPLFDLTVYVDAPIEIIRRRIIERWRHYGLTRDQAHDRATQNDLPNAELVVGESRAADLVVHTA